MYPSFLLYVIILQEQWTKQCQTEEFKSLQEFSKNDETIVVKLPDKGGAVVILPIGHDQSLTM